MLCIHKKIFALAFSVVSATALFAQKELPTESVDVIKDFDARLLESNKLKVTPTLPALDTTTKRQDYVIPPKPLTVVYDAPKLRPIAIKAGKKEDTYNGYVKLGGGVPTSVYGEAGYGITANKQFDGKVWLKHHQLSADRALENQKFSNTDFLLNGNYFLAQNLALEGKVGYGYDRYHFYGYDHDSLEFVPEAVRQDYKLLDIGGRVYNSERTESHYRWLLR